MTLTLWLILCAFTLFVGMAGLYSAGHRLALRRELMGVKRPSDSLTGAALFALFGLMLAFSFSGAIGRLENRRQLIVQEVNAIGTAYLRVDLLPAAAQSELRADFREYCTVRGDAFLSLPDPVLRSRSEQQTAALQQRIWQRSIAATADAQNSSTRVLLIPALNQMIDLTTARAIAARTHVPLMVIATIFVIALFCAWMAGYSIRESKNFGWMNMISLAGVTSLIFYVMLDIEFPRIGFVRLDDHNEMFAELALTMH